MRVWGLTGGIASGKSTVSAMLREAGIPVVDADEIAREVTVPGAPLLREIARAFPGSVTDAGALSREELGRQIFSDPVARARLNGLIHPHIRTRAAQQLANLAAAGHPVAVYDAPLLIETGAHQGLDGVIVVDVDDETQRRRLMLRNALSEDEARARIGSQMPLAEKLRFATARIDNSGSLEATRQQVAGLLARMRAPSSLRP